MLVTEVRTQLAEKRERGLRELIVLPSALGCSKGRLGLCWNAALDPAIALGGLQAVQLFHVFGPESQRRSFSRQARAYLRRPPIAGMLR
jgi:hypothetical protein